MQPDAVDRAETKDTESQDLPGLAAWHTHAAQVFDEVADGVLIVDGSCLIVHANAAAENVFGMGREDLVGRRCDDPAWSLCAPDGTPLARQEFCCFKALGTGEPSRSCEQAIRRPDGSQVSVLVSASPLRDEEGHLLGVVNSYTDITDLKRAEDALRLSDERNRSLLRLYRLLGQAQSYREILDALRAEFPEMMGYPSVWLFVLPVGGKIANMLDGRGTVEEAIKGLLQFDERLFAEVAGEKFVALPIEGDPMLEEIVSGGHIVVVEDARTDPRTNKAIVEAIGNRTIINVPVTLAEKTLGVIGTGTFGDEGVRPPSAAQLEYLEKLAYHVAVAMDRVRFLGERREAEEALSKTVDELEAVLDGVVQTLASTTSQRDPYTAMHQERVSRLACAIAEKMGLPEDTIEAIRIAGLLHDIGKVAVPTEILSKPSTLSEMEWGIIRSHVTVGHELLKSVPFHAPIAAIVAQHHERLDGSGYPDGLADEELLIEAKVLAVADVVEAMASHRPYRPALGLDVALEEIRQESGTLLDRDAVKACIDVFADDPGMLGA